MKAKNRAKVKNKIKAKNKANAKKKAKSKNKTLNMERLSKLASPVGTFVYVDEHITMIAPLAVYEDNLEFDRQICECGLKRFVRRMMPNEVPNKDRALRHSDQYEIVHAIAVAALENEEWLLVEEMTEGVRTKVSVGRLSTNRPK
jgi:hypothetical protein